MSSLDLSLEFQETCGKASSCFRWVLWNQGVLPGFRTPLFRCLPSEVRFGVSRRVGTGFSVGPLVPERHMMILQRPCHRSRSHLPDVRNHVKTTCRKRGAGFVGNHHLPVVHMQVKLLAGCRLFGDTAQVNDQNLAGNTPLHYCFQCASLGFCVSQWERLFSAHPLLKDPL